MGGGSFSDRKVVQGHSLHVPQPTVGSPSCRHVFETPVAVSNSASLVNSFKGSISLPIVSRTLMLTDTLILLSMTSSQLVTSPYELLRSAWTRSVVSKTSSCVIRSLLSGGAWAVAFEMIPRYRDGLEIRSLHCKPQTQNPKNPSSQFAAEVLQVLEAPVVHDGLDHVPDVFLAGPSDEGQ